MAWSIGKSLPTDLAKQVGLWAGSQSLIVGGEQSGLLTRIRGDGKRFVVRADEKLTAFLELEKIARRTSDRKEHVRR
jgi:hypothetical protein